MLFEGIRRRNQAAADIFRPSGARNGIDLVPILLFAPDERSERFFLPLGSKLTERLGKDTKT